MRPRVLDPRFQWIWSHTGPGTLVLPFRNNIFDYTHQHEPTPNQTPLFKGSLRGIGLYFSGVTNTQYLTVGDQTEWGFGAEPFTQVALFHLPSDFSAAAEHTINSLYYASLNHRSWVFGIDNTTPVMQISVNHTDGTSTNRVVIQANTALQAGGTYLAGVTRAGQTYRLFLNGRLDGQVTDGPATIWSDSTPEARIGNKHESGGLNADTFQGEILYDVVIRGYCASPAQMRELASDPFGPFVVRRDTILVEEAELVPVAVEEEVELALALEGYRWRDDDGDEDAATWLAAQDTDITRAQMTNTRLRVLVDATGDPDAEQYRLEYRVAESSDPWKVIE